MSKFISLNPLLIVSSKRMKEKKMNDNFFLMLLGPKEGASFAARGRGNFNSKRATNLRFF